MGLIPGTSVTELIGDHSHRPEIRVIEINLINGIYPTTSNRNTCKLDSSICREGVIHQYLSSQAGDVVASVRFTCDVEWTFLQAWELFVEIGQEVQEMTSRIIC